MEYPPSSGWGDRGHLLQSQKPGIIRLQPLGLGDILDGSVRAVRHNPGSMVGLSALVLAVFLVPSAALAIGIGTYVGRQVVSQQDVVDLATLPSSLAVLVFGQFATIVLTGLLIYVVGEAVLGHKPGIGQTWRSTRRRLLSLVGLNLLVGLAMTMVGAALLGPGVALLLSDSVGGGATALVLGSLIFLVFSIWLWVKTSMAGPVLVLERAGIRASLRRSWVLTRGAFWRLFGIMLLASVIASVASYLLQLPFVIATTVILSLANTGLEQGVWGATFLGHLGELFTGSITTPFVAAVTGLLYIDRRMRLEALDVTLVRAAQEEGP